VDPAQVCPDIDSFRHYTESSKGEWSVAKGATSWAVGWFSERSARYLAAADRHASGDRLLLSASCWHGASSVHNASRSSGAVHEIEGNYSRHAKAAREIAVEYFDATKISSKLLDDAFRKKD